MKIVLNNQVITDSTMEYKKGDLFLLTTQNKKYYEHQSIITPKELLTQVDTKFIGITGTNGKTTTAFIIGYILNKLGYKVIVQGTEGVYLNGKKIENKTLTTPPIIDTIKRVYKYKPDFFVMEVSSHSIEQNRIDGIQFSLKIFTNLTQDHLDYHKTMQNYKQVKEEFFKDDVLKVINKKYNLVVNKEESIFYPIDKTFKTKLKGNFNQENIQAAILGISKLLNKDIDYLEEVVMDFSGVSGRMEEVVNGVFVDFAHTPDGIEKVLNSFKNGYKIVVFGAGGERDKSKRIQMGKIADKYADYIILTNDNPRCENELDIINDIKKGISKKICKVIVNRKEAIKTAIDIFKNKKDVYLFILGKGDEQYIEKCNKKIRFNDKKTILELLS